MLTRRSPPIDDGRPPLGHGAQEPLEVVEPHPQRVRATFERRVGGVIRKASDTKRPAP